MNSKIAGITGIIDYGMGNLHSVQKAFEKVGATVKILTSPEQLNTVDKLVLPGVGAFKDAIFTLRDKGFTEPIKEFIACGKWFLGICLGLQMLFDVSYEDGEYEGLGLIAGQVQRFDFSNRDDQQELKIPHMGWNSLQINKPAPLYKGIKNGSYVYFVHSYYVVPRDKQVIATTTQHGIEFVSSIWRENIMATQFHPEKSQTTGLNMIKNFAEL